MNWNIHDINKDKLPLDDPIGNGRPTIDARSSGRGGGVSHNGKTHIPQGVPRTPAERQADDREVARAAANFDARLNQAATDYYNRPRTNAFGASHTLRPDSTDDGGVTPDTFYPSVGQQQEVNTHVEGSGGTLLLAGLVIVVALIIAGMIYSQMG